MADREEKSPGAEPEALPPRQLWVGLAATFGVLLLSAVARTFRRSGPKGVRLDATEPGGTGPTRDGLPGYVPITVAVPDQAPYSSSFTCTVTLDGWLDANTPPGVTVPAEIVILADTTAPPVVGLPTGVFIQANMDHVTFFLDTVPPPDASPNPATATVKISAYRKDDAAMTTAESGILTVY